MPVLSPDARHVLSGIGGGTIRIDGVIPPKLAGLTAGGWAWKDQDVVAGCGSTDGDNGRWVIWEYRLSTQTLAEVDGRGATATFGGGNTWVSYLASRDFFSFDSRGKTYPSLVARSCSPTGTILLCDHDNTSMWWGGQELHGQQIDTVQIGYQDIVLWWGGGQFHAVGAEAPVAPASSGYAARFAAVQGQAWLCQWNADLNQLVVYPWQTRSAGPLRGYALSGDEKDFNHDIGIRDDGVVVVATGVNQGETEIRYYELDMQAGRFRVNGGGWKDLRLTNMDVDVHPPILPIDPPILPIDPPIKPPIGPIDPPIKPPIKPPIEPPIEPVEPPMKLPVRDKYLIAFNGMYLTVDPAISHVLKMDAAAPGAWEEVEVTASSDTRYVLVRFCAANVYLRVDTVLWFEKKYAEAIQTYPHDKPDVDSGWQQAEASGHTIMFRGPDVDHRVGYTAAFRITNKDGSDFH